MDYCRSKRKLIVLATGLAIATLAVALNAQQRNAGPGVTRLTIESRREAIACGKSGAACAVAPFRLCPSENLRYSAWIATPFSRIAHSVHEFLQRRERPIPLEAGAANAWGWGIYVFPSEDPANADAIQRVLIRRGNDTIEPITTTLAPVTLTSPDGMKKELSKGFFTFPMEAFLPTSEIAIVLIGSAGDVTCRLNQQELSTLR